MSQDKAIPKSSDGGGERVHRICHQLLTDHHARSRLYHYQTRAQFSSFVEGKHSDVQTFNFLSRAAKWRAGHSVVDAQTRAETATYPVLYNYLTYDSEQLGRYL